MYLYTENSFLLMPENAPGSVNASGFFIWEEETLIHIEHVSKTFSGKYGTVHALDDVSIHVEKGDICGIIGFSGAGKSTLIRLVNGLETADSGKVTVCGKELSTLKKPGAEKKDRNGIPAVQPAGIQDGVPQYCASADPCKDSEGGDRQEG